MSFKISHQLKKQVLYQTVLVYSNFF